LIRKWGVWIFPLCAVKRNKAFEKNIRTAD
jgi:hypothetical protein